jgi:hypothetical protein
MSTQQILFLTINLIGGLAVLGSYVIGLGMFPEYREALWGEVRGNLRTGIIISMLFAALGYLAFCYVALFQNGLEDFTKSDWLNSYTFSILVAIFLISATFWMPSAIAYLNFSNTYWLVICIASLWVTAISLAALVGIVITSDVEIIGSVSHYVAIIGIGLITFHCLVFDAIIWSIMFTK